MTKGSAPIDKLARMVAKGFAETTSAIDEMGKDTRVLKGDLKNVRATMVTKTELVGELGKLRGDIDLLLDRHIGTFRRDYDELARRVKRLEEAVMGRGGR